jgi:RecB family exonuclease
MRDPVRHVGIAGRGRATGLNGSELRLSPSEADGYARCPRRYAIERKLNQAGDSIYARFGSVVHEVLDQVESEAMAQGKRHADYPTAVQRLDEIMDPGDFGGEPFAAAWRARAGEGLARLYNMWPSTATPVAIEQRVSFDLGDVTWRGRIDRIERDAAGVRIVDYKTSKTPVQLTEAAESLQLGFYALAAGADAELGKHGEPVAAEFWYPLVAAQKSLTTRALDMHNLPALGQRLIELGEAIAAESWDPAPGDWCERCPFASSCPARPEGGDQFA